MRKLLFAAATAVAMASIVPAAQATTYVCDADPACDFSEMDSTGTYGFKHDGGASFSDYYAFTISTAYDAVISLTASSRLGMFSFSSLELRTSDTPVYAVLGTFGPNGISDALTISLGAGTYFVLIEGMNTSAKALSYTGTIDIATPVPEPATWSLMLLGSAALGMAIRRRVTVSFA